MTACYLSMLSVGENSMEIMAALPAMTSGLGFGPAMAEWIVNAYLLASAVFSGSRGRHASRIDWLGLGLLAIFMVLLVDGLRAMATVATKPAAAVAPLGLAAIAFAALI